MKDQIKEALMKYTLMKLKEYGWKLVGVFPKGDFDHDHYDDYEICFKSSDRDIVSLVILNGIALRFSSIEAVERDYGDLAFVQLTPDELILFLDICHAVKELSDEDAFNAIIEGLRGVM